MHFLDIVLILVFLAVNLIVGFWSRGQRQTFQEYAIGDKKFSTAVLTATTVATWMSGSVFFLCLENTYTQGLYYAIASLGLPMALLIIGLFIGPRMSKFLNNVSVPHMLGDYYGPNVQAIAGMSAALHTAGFISVQFKAISKITEILFNYTGPEVTIATATLVILYSTSGGVKAVTFTDVVQFFTFGTLLPVLALAIWNHMGESASAQVTAVFDNDPRFSFREVVQWTPSFRAALVLMCYYMMPSLPTGLFQRMAMARNVKQLRESFMWATLLCLGVMLCLIWTALLLLADKSGLEKEALVPYLMQTYAYPGLKGLLGIGVIALAMSTADSYLNSCAVVITNDVLPRLVPNYKASLGVAKGATLGVGFLSLLFTLQMQDMLKTILFSASFYAPVSVMPMLLTVFGFQTSRRVVLLAMGAGFVTVVSCLLYFQDVNSFFPGMLVNLVVMLGAHYGLGEKGGWGHNPLPKHDFVEYERPVT
ncbi:MAG: sodium:solute symporter family protein [Bacteroidota bacterium]